MKQPARFSAALADALFPNKCVACGRFFHPPQTAAIVPEAPRPVSAGLFEMHMGAFLCRACIPLFFPVASPKCEICGEMFQSRAGSEDHVCGQCRKQEHHFALIRSAGQYDGVFMTVLQALKYKRKTRLARPLGRLLFDAFISYPELRETELIAPVPLHASRARGRGFNQSALILKQWPLLLRQHGVAAVQIAGDGDLLKRVRKTPAQTGLSRSQRMTNIRQAFVLSAAAPVEGKTVLLIDDVCTTGATVDECARVLKKGGAQTVNVLTLARASAKS